MVARRGADLTAAVVGLGAGGHARCVIETLRLNGRYEVIGLLDPRADRWRTVYDGIPVLGDDTLLATLKTQGVTNAFIGVAGTGDTRPREKLYGLAREHGFEIVNVIHPRAVISSTATLGSGITVLAAACINPGASLGQHIIVNTASVIEHDCVIGDHVHIATGARLAGGVSIGRGSHVGLGAAILQNVCVGEYAVIGAGAVVTRDVPDGAVVVGVPARQVQGREHRA